MLEHVRSTARPLAAMQRALSPLNERAIGCHLDRDTFGRHAHSVSRSTRPGVGFLIRSVGGGASTSRRHATLASCGIRVISSPSPPARAPQKAPRRGYPAVEPGEGVWRRASVFRYASGTRRLTLDQGRVFPGGIDDGKGVEGVEGVKGVELLRHRGEVNLCRVRRGRGFAAGDNGFRHVSAGVRMIQ